MYTNQEPLTQGQPVLVDERVRPVAAEAPFAPPVGTPVRVVETPLPVAGATRTATATRRRFAFDSVLVGIVGLALIVVGLLAITRAGVNGPMNSPVVKVFGFTHTATLGIIETALGVLLLVSAAAMSRAASVFFGLVLGVGGIIGAVQTSSFKKSLALESDFAWIAVAAAAVVVLASLAIPRMLTETTTVEAA